jgi:hypothetical protein
MTAFAATVAVKIVKQHAEKNATVNAAVQKEQKRQAVPMTKKQRRNRVAKAM